MAEEKTVTVPEAPIRTKPLPLEFPGVRYYDDQEIEVSLDFRSTRKRLHEQ